MLNFQDFLKFSKILKSSVQYLFRDISNVKIRLFLRQNRKKEKKIFLKIYFFSKMLNFQDFSKFSQILKSTLQYLFKDISNVKIGQFLRQSR